VYHLIILVASKLISPSHPDYHAVEPSWYLLFGTMSDCSVAAEFENKKFIKAKLNKQAICIKVRS